MQERVADSFKEFFLLEFTRCLIEESVNINDVVRFSDNNVKKSVKGIMSDLSDKKKERGLEARALRKSRVAGRGIFGRGVKRLGKVIKKPFSAKISRKKVSRRPGSRLRISEPKFAQRLQYIKPIPTGQFVDMGKLNSLISPPLVRQIDCNGAGSEIIVRTNRAKKLKITLTEEEINAIINAFSVAARIPVMDGVFRAAAGNVELVAMVSSTVGSKFIIRKIRTGDRFR